MFAKLEKLFMRDIMFIPLYMALCAGVVGGTHLYITHGTGLFFEFAVGQMIQDSMKTGIWSATIGLAGGFLIARVLEGPLVGLLDIGGSTMGGVGVGVVGLLMSMGMNFLITNFTMSLITGALIGLVIGIIIMGIRKLIPDGVAAGGTAIMMGVGHQLSAFLAPLILIAAMTVSLPLGIAALIGGIIFYLLDKGVVGGVVIGMFIAAFFVHIK